MQLKNIKESQGELGGFKVGQGDQVNYGESWSVSHEYVVYDVKQEL